MKNASSFRISRRRLLQASAAGGLSLALPAYIGRAQAQTEVIHFGGSLPLTGTYEKVARIYRDAYDFWGKTVGGQITVAGKPREVKWTIYDDENNASRTAQLTEKLISDDNVDCIVGAYGTDTVLAQGSIAQRHGRALIQAGAASVRVDEEIGGHTAFTLVGGARNYYKSAIDYLATMNPKPATLGMVVMDDPVYHEHAAGIRERCEAAGIKIVVEAVLPMNAQDFRPAALKFKSAGDIDIIASPAWDVVCIKLAQEMATLGVQPKAFIGGHLTTNPVVKETLGPKLKDVIGVTLWTPSLKYTDPHFESPQAFATAFEAAYGYAPTYHAAMAYSIPVIYEHILKDADPADPLNQEKIKQALLQIEIETVWGPISFNEKGRIQREGMPVIQWLGDDPQPNVVYPTELAQAEGVYPKAAF
jgi:ABC-type branched-chain amino acid transport systems, periplasmic component